MFCFNLLDQPCLQVFQDIHFSSDVSFLACMLRLADVLQPEWNAYYLLLIALRPLFVKRSTVRHATVKYVQYVQRAQYVQFMWCVRSVQYARHVL